MANGASSHSVSVSLPLMGIGNVGDHSVRHSGVVSSLPLMGIGNLLGSMTLMGGPKYHSLPLMGIGNEKPPSRRRKPPGSHYPSWGSET